MALNFGNSCFENNQINSCRRWYPTVNMGIMVSNDMRVAHYMTNRQVNMYFIQRRNFYQRRTIRIADYRQIDNLQRKNLKLLFTSNCSNHWVMTSCLGRRKSRNRNKSAEQIIAKENCGHTLRGEPRIHMKRDASTSRRNLFI